MVLCRAALSSGSDRERRWRFPRGRQLEPGARRPCFRALPVGGGPLAPVTINLLSAERPRPAQEESVTLPSPENKESKNTLHMGAESTMRASDGIPT